MDISVQTTIIALGAAALNWTALAVEVTGSTAVGRRVRALFRRIGALGRM